MSPRNFRSADPPWFDSLATAEAAGENLADRLRDFLDWYSQQPGARPPMRPKRAVRAKTPKRREVHAEPQEPASRPESSAS